MPSYTQPSQTDTNLIFSKKLWLFILSWMAATTFLVSCDEGPNGLGSEVLPNGDLVNVTFSDTSTVQLQTLVFDSINTYQSSLQLMGNYVDPLFGTISAKTYTQVFPRSGLNFGDPSELIFDSLVLKLTFASGYGRLDQAQTLRVYELTEDMPDTTLIYSSRQLAHDSKDLSNGKQLDFTGGTIAPIVRVRLDDALGERILFGDSTVLADRNSFLDQVLKGLVLETDPVKFVSREPGAVFSLFGNDSDSLLVLHYRKYDTASQTYLPYREPFLITNSTPRYHSLTRTNTSGTLFAENTQVPDTARSYEFLQSGLLTKTWVQFPTLNFDEPALVSRAELILPVDPATLGFFMRFFHVFPQKRLMLLFGCGSLFA